MPKLKVIIDDNGWSEIVIKSRYYLETMSVIILYKSVMVDKVRMILIIIRVI